MNTTWRTAAYTIDVTEGVPVDLLIEGESIALVRRGEQYFAVENRCSHMGLALTGGPMEGDELVCPFHKARFCVKTGELRNGPGFCGLKTYPVRVVGRRIEVGVEVERQVPALLGKRAAAAFNASPA